MLSNSALSVDAVPVIPQRFGNYFMQQLVRWGRYNGKKLLPKKMPTPEERSSGN